MHNFLNTLILHLILSWEIGKSDKMLPGIQFSDICLIIGLFLIPNPLEFPTIQVITQMLCIDIMYVPGDIIYVEPPETYDLTWMSFTLLNANYLLFGMKICKGAVLALSAIPGVLDTLTYQVS